MIGDAELMRVGIAPEYPGPDGKPVAVPCETRKILFEALGGDASAGLVSTEPAEPIQARCFVPEWLNRRRAWGVTAQLYELRSARNWGIGDFADLSELCRIAGPAGADFVGLNPLHALFIAEPGRCSPFSPSSRRFLYPLYIAVDQVEGYVPDEREMAESARLRALPLVDYAGVANVKLAALRRIWGATSAKTNEAFLAFAQEGGAALRRHATFEALSLDMAAKGHGSGWRQWPSGFREVRSRDVEQFASEHADEVQFHVWLQWLARRQLAEAAAVARDAGMRIGLYLDFAVGDAPDGSATWSDPDLAIGTVKIGAPPDLFSRAGQDWGMAPLSPAALAANSFAAYRVLMAAAMRDAGALRLDHAMALRRLFWIPNGRGAAEGGYVTYPMNGMLEVLADLSNARQVVLIGEDLGHVPDGFRETMSEAAILSYRILPFERAPNGFCAPQRWPALALACLSTHDLPTLKGWWNGSDIALRSEHGLIDVAQAGLQHRHRVRERRQLLAALRRNAVLPTQGYRALQRDGRMEGPAFEWLAVATHRFIARTPSRLAALRLADAVGETEPTNLPGTDNEYPNWRRKLETPLEHLGGASLFPVLAAAMRRERPR